MTINLGPLLQGAEIFVQKLDCTTRVSKELKQSLDV